MNKLALILVAAFIILSSQQKPPLINKTYEDPRVIWKAGYLSAVKNVTMYMLAPESMHLNLDSLKQDEMDRYFLFTPDSSMPAARTFQSIKTKP